MECNHGSEYQLKCIHQDGTEELADWITESELARAIAGIKWGEARTYWLRKRNLSCPNCANTDREILECPVSNMSSTRYRIRDSSHIASAASKNRYSFGSSR